MLTALAENMMMALHEAIRSQQRTEMRWGYNTDSAMLAGWKEVLRELEKGNEVLIKKKDGFIPNINCSKPLR